MKTIPIGSCSLIISRVTRVTAAATPTGKSRRCSRVAWLGPPPRSEATLPRLPMAQPSSSAVAEKKRAKRLDYLRKAVWKKGAIGGNYAPGIKLDLEMPTLFTDMWRFWKFDPIMLRRAKALAHVLDNITIFITDQAQIVGYMGSLPHTIFWRVDGASMVNEEVYNEPGIHTEPEEESLKKVAELNDYWAGQTAVDKVARLLDPEDVVKFMSGAIGWGVPTSAYGYSNKKQRERPDKTGLWMLFDGSRNTL